MGTYRNTCPDCEDTYETDCWEPIKCPFCELLEVKAKLIAAEQWKEGAITVLSEWNKAWVAAGKPGKIGESIALATAKEITRLKTRIT